MTSLPLVVSMGGGDRARISSPSSTRGLPSNIPHPHQSLDKGAIEGLRQGRMPRGCRIQIKGKETQPCLPSASSRRGRQNLRLLGSWGLDGTGAQSLHWSLPLHSQTTPSTSWECSHLKISGSKFRLSNCGGSTGGFSHSHPGEGALALPNPKLGWGGQGRMTTNSVQSPRARAGQ